MLACMLSRVSHVQLFVTPWTVACLAPLSMGFSRHEYWCGLPWGSHARDSPNPGIEPVSPATPALQTDSLPAELPGKPHTSLGKSYILYV